MSPAHSRRRSLSIFLLTVLLSVAGSVLSKAQVSIFAKFKDGTGAWAGELTGDRAGWVKMESLSVGISNTITTAGTNNKAGFDTAFITKEVDTVSPSIFGSIAAGTPVSDVVFEFEKPGTTAGSRVVFYRVEMKNVYFTRSSASPNAEDGKISEGISFTCTAMRVTYIPLLPDGTQGTPVVKSWNLTTNSATFQ